MKTLDEYFLMVMFTLLQNRVRVFRQMLCLIWTENMAAKGLMSPVWKSITFKKNAYQLSRALRVQIRLGRSFQLRWLRPQGIFHIHQQLHITNTNTNPLTSTRWIARVWLINVQENLLSGRRLSFRYRVPHVYAVQWNGIIAVWCTYRDVNKVLMNGSLKCSNFTANRPCWFFCNSVALKFNNGLRQPGKG